MSKLTVIILFIFMGFLVLLLMGGIIYAHYIVLTEGGEFKWAAIIVLVLLDLFTLAMISLSIDEMRMLRRGK